MKTLLLLLPILAISSCNSTQTQSSDVSSGNINAAAPYLWPVSSFPKQVKISTAFSAAESTAITDMSVAWETAIANKVDFFTVSGTTSELNPNVSLDSLNDSVSGIYKLNTWPSSLSGSALAVTQIFGRRYNVGSADEYVAIAHADILMNYDFYDFRTSDPGTSGSYDMRTVVLHEMGHYLGLAHKYGTTVMTPSVGTYTKNQVPKSTDIVDISDKYHISSGSSSSSQIAAGVRKVYVPKAGDEGQEMKMLIELRADGDCRHYENGVLFERHSVSLK